MSRPLAPLLLLPAAFLAPGCGSPGPLGRGRLEFPELRAHELRRSDIDVEHYAIDVVLHPAERRIEATCRVRFQARVDGLARVDLDLDGLEVRSVSDDGGQGLVFLHGQGVLSTTLASPLSAGELGELSIRYGGTPTRGLWFSGADADGVATQVFTQGQCDDNRGWFPCFDHPSDRVTSEVRVTMPAGWTSIAAGERIDRVEGEGLVTEHWRMNATHPSYLVTLVAGDLLVREDAWDGIPLIFAAEGRYGDWMEASFEETDEILAFLSDYTGIRYPYPKYAQACVANFPWGGMENVSATTLTPLTLNDDLGNRDEGSRLLIAHEAAHQWFGDLLTCVDWPHVWLNEGFATYMELAYVEQTRGVDEFRARMRDTQEEYLRSDVGRDRRPTVWNVYREPSDLFWGGQTYEGGAARLHLLRFLLGDDVFREAVRTYAAENAGRNVDTDDFQRAVEKVSGRELGWFFEQWFHRRGYPELETRWRFDGEDGELTFEVAQVQSPADGTPRVFRTPVELEIRTSEGVSTFRVDLDERRERFSFPCSTRPLYVRFDPHGWIPKVVRWNRAPSEWLAIAAQDDDVNGRRDAVRALGALALQARQRRPAEHELYVAEIVGRLRKDTCPWVRADAARALGVAGGAEARERLAVAAADDPEARVRIAALEALRPWGPDGQLAELGREQFEARFSWATMGAAAGLVTSAAPDEAYSWLTRKLLLDSPHDQLREHLLGHLGGLGSAGVREQLLRWARDETVAPTARAAAVRALAGREKHRLANARALGELLDTPSFRLRRALVEALAGLDNAESRRILAAYYPGALNAEERRAIERALGGTGVRP